MVVPEAQILSVDLIRECLQSVKDPEIPTISIVDLGMLTDIQLDTSKRDVRVVITPTFVGCPAIDYIKRDIERSLEHLGLQSLRVDMDFRTPWSSNRLSEQGRSALAAHGLALPPRFEGEFEPEIMLNAACPFCSSTNTRLVSPFGPTLCRAFYHCNSCQQGFEQFKAV